jgi:hypothetical protein
MSSFVTLLHKLSSLLPNGDFLNKFLGSPLLKKRIVLNVILLNIMPLLCLEFTGIQFISVLTVMALTRISLD